MQIGMPDERAFLMCEDGTMSVERRRARCPMVYITAHIDESYPIAGCHFVTIIVAFSVVM